MDFGTMTTKVSKGKYRSLEEFAVSDLFFKCLPDTKLKQQMVHQSDFRLVTGNAKAFNPPETIYHTEADRIEVFGLDHISKACSHSHRV